MGKHGRKIYYFVPLCVVDKQSVAGPIEWGGFEYAKKTVAIGRHREPRNIAAYHSKSIWNVLRKS